MVAPVVLNECGGVLQLEGDQRGEEAVSIEEWSSSEGAHRKGADGGDARAKSGTEKGFRRQKTGELDTWAMGEACVLRHGRTRRTTHGGEKFGRWVAALF
jgi:hypothetical protein